MRREFVWRSMSNGNNYFGWRGWMSPFKPANVTLAQEACWYIADLKLSYYIHHSLANGDVARYGVEYKGKFYHQTDNENIFVRETETGEKKTIKFTSDKYGCLEDVILEES